MEEKNNNYVKDALYRIEKRKVLLNNKTMDIDDAISKLTSFISYNNVEISYILSDDMRYYINDSICNIILIESAIILNQATKCGIDPNMFSITLLFGEVIRKLNNKYYQGRFVPAFKDSVKKIRELKKLNRFARKKISDKDNELECYRKECECKAHEIIHEMFSTDNLYYDAGENNIKDPVKQMQAND